MKLLNTNDGIIYFTIYFMSQNEKIGSGLNGVQLTLSKFSYFWMNFACFFVQLSCSCDESKFWNENLDQTEAANNGKASRNRGEIRVSKFIGFSENEAEKRIDQPQCSDCGSHRKSVQHSVMLERKQIEQELET